jgi:thioredoxin-dependent peroxiredoxin
MQQLEEGVFFDDSILPRKTIGEQLEPGFRIHDFIFTTVKGQSFSQADLADRKLWIAFYRYAGCPICASHFDEVLGMMEKLNKFGVTFIAVFDSKTADIPDRFKEKNSEQCLIVGNDSLGVYEIFGVEKSWLGLMSVGTLKARVEAGKKGYSEGTIDGSLRRMPAHILANEAGEVIVAKYARNAGDHVAWPDVWKFAQARKATSGDLELLG